VRDGRRHVEVHRRLGLTRVGEQGQVHARRTGIAHRQPRGTSRHPDVRIGLVRQRACATRAALLRGHALKGGTGPGSPISGRSPPREKSNAEVRSPDTVRRQALMFGARTPSQVSTKRVIEVWSNTCEHT
jgi:hypothetical protein